MTIISKDNIDYELTLVEYSIIDIFKEQYSFYGKLINQFRKDVFIDEIYDKLSYLYKNDLPSSYKFKHIKNITIVCDNYNNPKSIEDYNCFILDYFVEYKNSDNIDKFQIVYDY